MKSLLYVIVILIGLISLSMQNQLPSFFTKCKVEDKNCIKKSMENGVEVLAQGYKEFDIESFDPFVVNETILEPGTGPISVYQKYTNTNFKNISKIIVSNVDIDLDKCNIEFSFLCPEIYFFSDYILKGAFFQYQLDANDKMNGTITNSTMKMIMTCEKYKMNNFEYIRIIETKMSLDFNNTKIHIGEVKKGDDDFNKNFNDLLNDDPEGLVTIMQDSAADNLGRLTQTVSNKLFAKVALKDLFLD